MQSAITLLDKYDARLFHISSHLRLIGISLAARDARLRNEEVALSVQRAALKQEIEALDRRMKSSKSARRNGAVVDDLPEEKDPSSNSVDSTRSSTGGDDIVQRSSTKNGISMIQASAGKCPACGSVLDTTKPRPASRRIGFCEKSRLDVKGRPLPPEAEALMRGLFKQLDRSQIGGECGKVKVSQLIKAFRTDSRISYMMNQMIGNQNDWEQVLMERLPKREILQNDRESGVSNDHACYKYNSKQSECPGYITWGEFLLCFLPNVAAELRSYRESADNLRLHTIDFLDKVVLSAREGSYSKCPKVNEGERQTLERVFESAHLEIIFPPNQDMVSCSFPNLSRMDSADLLKMIKRLLIERAWLINILHLICLEGPRVHASDIAHRLCGARIKRTMKMCAQHEKACTEARAQISDLKKSLEEACQEKSAAHQEVTTLRKIHVEMNNFVDLHKQLLKTEEELTETKKKNIDLSTENKAVKEQAEEAQDKAVQIEKQSLQRIAQTEQRGKELSLQLREREQDVSSVRSQLNKAKQDLLDKNSEYDLLHARWQGMVEGATMAKYIPHSSKAKQSSFATGTDTEYAIHPKSTVADTSFLLSSTDSSNCGVNAKIFEKLDGLAALTNCLLLDDEKICAGDQETAS